MADDQRDLTIQGRDPVAVTFSDGTTLDGDFLRFYPRTDGVSCAFTVPQGAANITDVTGVYYINEFRHILKLTPTTP